MALSSQYTRGKFLRCFSALGPYIREQQCIDNQFFFDCLAVCVDAKQAPEKREFLGWWLILNQQDDGFSFEYQIGLYNQDGDWVLKTPSKKDDTKALFQTIDNFHPRLKQALDCLELKLIPSPKMTDFPLDLSA